MFMFNINSFNFNVENGTKKYVSKTPTSESSQFSRIMAYREPLGLFRRPRYVIKKPEPLETPPYSVSGIRKARNFVLHLRCAQWTARADFCAFRVPETLLGGVFAFSVV